MSKFILTAICLVFCFITKAQYNPNVITLEQYQSITFNSKTLSEIQATNGVESQVRNLLGNPTQIDRNDEWRAYVYQYDGLMLSFQDGELGILKVTGSNVSVAINGRNIKVGNNLRVLGIANQNTRTDGTKSILYVPRSSEWAQDCVYVSFNNSTRTISEIGFYTIP